MKEKSETTEKQRLQELRKLVSYHQQKYHKEDNPEISDEAYDSLVKELKSLELKLEGSLSVVSEAVGGEVSSAFLKVKHKVRQWSFDNVFDFAELRAWENKLKRFLEKEGESTRPTFVTEHKIDGLKLVLDYREGNLFRATTRGDGEVGEDVTHTAKTIKSLPQKLTQAVDLLCVGEVWMAKKDFENLNKNQKEKGESLFANPRNAAAGSLRQLDPEVARERNLSLFVYDVDEFLGRKAKLFAPETQDEELSLLKTLGLPTNPYPKVCNTIEEIEKVYQAWIEKKDTLPYGIDGLVIKTNEIFLQKIAGYTAKSPRFGVAYKFPAVEATTVIESIELQVGRTGVITPVAYLKSVLIDGSVVSRATLHNEDQINKLDIRVGDTVIIRKAGDIIPEVVSVIKELRSKNSQVYKFPEIVEGCGGDGRIERIKGEAAYRCVSLDSTWLKRQRLYYFVSKNAFDIDGVGPKIIDALLENNLIKDAADLFTLHKEQFLTLPNFKDKSASNSVSAIEKAKAVSLSRLLVGLSIELVGEETAELLAKNFKTITDLRNCTEEDLLLIEGIGEITVQKILMWQKDKEEQDFLDKLLKYIIVENEVETSFPQKFSGLTFVFTGTLENFSRAEAGKRIKQHGGKVLSALSKQTTYLVKGKGGGSKSKKAEELGVKVLSEIDFLDLLE